MKRISRVLWKTMLVMIICCGFMSSHTYADEQADLKPIPIPVWSILWSDSAEGIDNVVIPSPTNKWITIRNGDMPPEKPKDISSAWVRFQLPTHVPKDYGIFIEQIYAQQLRVYIGDRLVREINFDFPTDEQRSLFPVGSEDGGEFVYLKLGTSMDRLGLHSEIKLDHYSALTRSFIFRDLQNIILGCAFLFIAAIMLICSFFLKQIQLASWISLSLLILALGTIFITYSPFMYANFTKYGDLFLDLFDISLAVFLPTLTYFFEKIFDNGNFKWIRAFRKFQIIYSAISIAL